MNQQIDTIRIRKIQKEPELDKKRQPIFALKKSFLKKRKQSGLFFDKMISLIIHLLVFLTPIFFLPFTNEAYEFNKFYLIFYLSGLAFIFWLLKMLFQKEVKIIRTPLDLLILVFLGAMVLSTLFSADKISSLLGFYGRFSDSLILFLSLGMMYFVMVNNLVKSQTSKLLNLFLFSSFIAIIIGLCSIFEKFIIPLDMAKVITFNPVAGSLQGLSVFAAAIIVFLIVQISNLAYRQAGFKTQNHNSKLKTFFQISFVLLALLFLTVINFNPAWIVLLAGMGFWVFMGIFRKITLPNLSFARRETVLSIVLIIFSLLFLFAPTAGERINSAVLSFTPSDSPLEKGRELPQEVILDKETSNEIVKKTFFAHSVFGSGLGTFSQDFSLRRPIEFNQSRFWNLRFDKANSEISERLATTGLVGIFTWLILLWVFFGLMVKTKKTETGSWQDEDEFKTRFQFAAAAFALFAGTIFYHQNITLRFSLWLFIALGICLFISSRKLKTTQFSLEENSEKANIFKGISLAAILVLIVSFFMMGKFYYADAFYKKGIVQQDLGQAIENYQKAADLNPYRFTYRIVLAKSHLRKAINEAKKEQVAQDDEIIKQEVAQAIDQAKKAVELSPKDVAAKETLAMIYRDIVGIAQGADEWALRSFEEALALEPLNPVLATETGKARAVLENNEKAIEYFIKAIFFKEDYLDAYLHLALAYEKQEKNNLAIKELKKVAQPEGLANLEILYQLGRLNYNQDNADEAIKYFKKVLDIFPNHSNSLYSLGVVYQKQGRDSDALKMFERVLQLNPENEDVRAKIKKLE